MARKPGIIVLSMDGDAYFDWVSDGWNSIDQDTADTPQSRRLMAKAEAAIMAAEDVPDAIRRLRMAGFTVIEKRRAK